VAYAYPAAHSQEAFNRPEGCTAEEETITIAGDSFSKENGAETCVPSNNNVAWTLFPWVVDTNAAGKFPGCANGNTVITAETSPAFVGDVVASPAVVATACQNFVPVGNATDANGPAPGN